MDNATINVLVGAGALVFNIPMVMFFVTRMLKQRDKVEAQLIAAIQELALKNKDLDKAISLNNKDIEHAAALAGSLGDVAERTNKLERDIDNYFNTTRSLEEKSYRYEKLMRGRTHFLSNAINKITGKMYKLHGDEGELDLGELPRE